LDSTLTLADSAATEQLAIAIAPHLGPGDTLGLTGGLGAGKSTFARALIGARLSAVGRAEDIPSPTYTLVQTYDVGPEGQPIDLWHADLYRLGSASEIAELGLEEAFATGICLVEWADRLGPALPARRLMLALDMPPGGEDVRCARLTSHGNGWSWLPAALAETTTA
jgi:tRNA threonylcarbamoyladenosine biosynthesis protein TsaE